MTVAYLIIIWIIFTLAPAVASAQATDLAILAWSCSEEGGAITVKGEIRNTGQKPLSMTAAAVFRAIGGQLVTTQKAVPLFSPLPPQQTSPFEMSIRANRKVADCELAFQDLETGAVSKAPSTIQLPGDLPLRSPDPTPGRSLYHGKGVCWNCHGRNGNPEDIAADTRSMVRQLSPQPTDFRNPSRLKFKSRLSTFRAIKYGVPRTAMVPMGEHVTDDEILDIMTYIGTLARTE